MNCRIKTLFVILFFLVGCQGYDDQEPIQRTAAKGVVAMDEDELEGISDEDLFLGQVSAGGVAEKKLGSWSASGTLTTIVHDPTVPIHTVQLQTNFQKSGPYTLQFSLDLPEDLAFNIDAVAEIDWKVEGNWVHRIVNVRSGTAISGTAEACRVTIKDATNTGFAFVDYNVSVQIAMGTRAATSQPPTYSPVVGGQIIPAGGSIVYQFPVNSGAVSIWMTSLDYSNPASPKAAVAGSVIGLMRSASGLIGGSVDLTKPEWYPIPPTATEVIVYNSGAVDTHVSLPMFGIEG